MALVYRVLGNGMVKQGQPRTCHRKPQEANPLNDQEQAAMLDSDEKHANIATGR